MPTEDAKLSFRKLKLAGLAACTLAGCAGADDGGDPRQVIDVKDEAALTVSWDEYRARAVVAADGYYIAEWDLVFPSEAEVRAHFERERGADHSKLAVFQQLSTGYEPTFVGTAALDIKYCVSNSFTNKSTVVADMALANQGWQDVMNVAFRYVPSEDGSCNQNNANVDFAVIPTTNSGLWGCGSSKLVWGNLGCTVNGVSGIKGVLTLQYSMLGAEPYPGTTAIGLIRHEVGHILGFRHEHPWAPGGCVKEAPTSVAYDSTGRRLTDYDQRSVMHYPIPECNGVYGTDNVISSLDGQGGRSIYGMPAAWHVPRLAIVLN